MFCPYCGKQVDSDKKFCIYCGASLTPPPGQPGGVASDVPARENYYAPKVASILPGGVPAIIGIIVIIFLIGFIGYSAMNGSWVFSPGTAAKPAPGTTLSPGGGSVARSYVVVNTETLTPVPTTLLPVTATVLTTAITTIPTVKKPTICSSDMFACNNQCTSIRTDSRNCGRCGVVCSPGMSCQNGNCRVNCTANQASCQDGCFNLTSDAKHCGSCTNSCPRGLICERSTCAAPPTPMLVPV